MDKLWENLRGLANELRFSKMKPIYFPGWDVANSTPELMHSIRDAAFAIHGNTDYDSGIKVTKEQLADLITYIADMLEE